MALNNDKGEEMSKQEYDEQKQANAAEHAASLQKAAQSHTTGSDEQMSKLILGAITDCWHEINAEQVILYRNAGNDKNALGQLVDRIVSALSQSPAAEAVVPFGYVSSKSFERLEKLRTTAHSPADCHINLYAGKDADDDIPLYLSPNQPAAIEPVAGTALWDAITRLERLDSTQEERFSAADALRELASTPQPVASQPSQPAAGAQRDEDHVLHVLRNPFDFSDDEVRAARIKGAELIERYRDAYLNMRQFAEANGLDTVARNQ
jgi:hypothetical protein